MYGSGAQQLVKLACAYGTCHKLLTQFRQIPHYYVESLRKQTQIGHGLPVWAPQKALNSRERRILYTYNYAYYVAYLRMDRARVPANETSQED